MKAVGYVRCGVCGELHHGYRPRGWKPGDQLAAWAHGPAGVYGPRRLKCDGSYKQGTESKLYTEIAGLEVR